MSEKLCVAPVVNEAWRLRSQGGSIIGSVSEAIRRDGGRSNTMITPDKGRRLIHEVATSPVGLWVIGVSVLAAQDLFSHFGNKEKSADSDILGPFTEATKYYCGSSSNQPEPEDPMMTRALIQYFAAHDPNLTPEEREANKKASEENYQKARENKNE